MSEPIAIPELAMLDIEALNLPPEGQDSYSAEQYAHIAGALRRTTAYARMLWADLDAMRRYLLQSLPPDPRLPGPVALGASPTGPDDEQGWARWCAAYAEVTSVLAGPRGDSGFGESEARREAQTRRLAPTRRVEAQLIERRRRALDPPAPPAKSRTAAKVAAIAAGTLILRRFAATRMRRATPHRTTWK